MSLRCLASASQYGRSMIEMLGVLAIIGILSVGGIAGYSKAMTKNKINDVIDQVSMIVTNTRTLYAQQMDYSGLNNEHAKNLGIIPESMVVRAHSTSGEGSAAIVAEHIKHKLSGNVIIAGAGSRVGEVGSSATSASRTAFIVDFEDLPRDACVTIATSDWGSGSSAGFIGLQVKGENNEGVDPEALVIGCAGSHALNGVTTACPNGSVQTVPLNVAEASKACSCSGENTCSIVWKYF